MTRVWSGAVLLTLAVAAVWLTPALPFLAVAEALLALAMVEYVRLARAGGAAVPAAAAGVAAAFTCAAFSGVFGGSVQATLDVVLMSSFVALAGLAVADWRGDSHALGGVATSIMPALYLGLPLGAMVAIREARGREALLLLMSTVATSDTAQYYTGRALGHRLLAPAISPKKTVEGAIGGFVLGVLVMAVAGAWWLPSVPLALRVVLGLAVVASGILGDLFESMLKRSAAVKDSSTLIPGHGGVLDRIDALLFAAPIYYVVLKYV